MSRRLKDRAKRWFRARGYQLVVGGGLIIDDDGRWRDRRKAVDEFFAMLENGAPLLARTAGSDPLGIKTCV